MKKCIELPAADKDERIGSVFNHLFSVILQHEDTDGAHEVIWDFSKTTFFHPFFLFALSVFYQGCKFRISCKNIPPQLSDYLQLVKFHDSLTIKDNQSLSQTLNRYLHKSYIPICKFDRQNQNIDSMQTIIQSVIERQTNLDTLLKTPVSYMISELICNIDQHSNSQYGYIYTQYLQRENCLNICIADDGITIYGSYVKANRLLDIIGDNEAEALKLANEGYSTKDLPDAENRGFGLSTTKDMIVRGLGGAFFMLSGSAFHRFDRNETVYLRLPEPLCWHGTIILIKLPLTVPPKFNYLQFVR